MKTGKQKASGWTDIPRREASSMADSSRASVGGCLPSSRYNWTKNRQVDCISRVIILD